jgi:ubiquinone/menaquinone biosynthesis C-methylase UbiE
LHRFDPADRHRLLGEQRYQLMPPDRILDSLPLRPDAVVGDIGCGPGYFTLPLAERLPQGHVHAVDVEPVMIQTVRERAEEVGLTNISTLLSAEQSIPLPPASLDGAFLALVYHEFNDRAAYLAMLRRLMRPGSWLGLLEWEQRQNPVGGPPLDARIGPGQAETELAAAGWRITGRHAPNEWIYLLVAELPPGSSPAWTS